MDTSTHDMRKSTTLLLLLAMAAATPMEAQRVLTLDSCRAMALRGNKQMSVAQAKQEMAANVRKSARTKYLPHVNAVGGYMFTSKEISILNDGQKAMLSSIGGDAFAGVTSSMQSFGANLTADQKTAIDGVLAPFGTTTEQAMSDMGEKINNASEQLNARGRRIVDAFRTDTRNIFAASVTLTQPLFMGGSIIAMNKMADLGEQMAANATEGKKQQTLYDTEQAYWTVVSLTHKKRLAESYLTLVKKLDADVAKMIKEGVATRSDGLSVSVKANEAEMTLSQVNDGLTLARMLLCQKCGLPLDENIKLADEDSETIPNEDSNDIYSTNTAAENRPELKMLQNAMDLSKQAVNLLKAGNLPQVMLIGGYSVSNPNVYNGFQKKFGGAWNVGVLVRVPIFNWGDVTYKVRAAKNAATIAALEHEEACELANLQVNQNAFRMSEANKKLALAHTSTERAEENLRCADLGFKEGVIQLATVMEAQTAWLQAQSQKIDAEIDVKLSRMGLRKALGTLQ